MKVVTLIGLVLCGFAHAETFAGDGYGSNVKAQLGAQQFHLTAGSDLVTAEDQHLSQRLAELERTGGRNLVADLIYNALESFRDVVINGNDDLPPLDPLHIPHLGPVEIESTGITILLNGHNFNMDGLRWYLVDHVTFNALRLSLGLRVTVPWIIFTGSYDANARILLIEHAAGGNYRVFINRLETSVDIRLGTNIFGGGTLILRQLGIRIVIHDVAVQIDGMVGSSVLNSLINSFVQSAAQNLLVDQMEAISQRLSEELFDVVNDFLADFTIDDLLN